MIVPRARWYAPILALLALGALAFGSIATLMPPAPAPASAPADRFSAGRAFAHVQAIGQQVHVAGSPAAQAVRDDIRSYLADLGLQPQVWDSVGAATDVADLAVLAHVSDVIAVLPGSDSTGRLFLMAHYDSTQVSFGGNDDGAGVATLLETARALTTGPRPRNDIVFIFTDAEEACLCGAEAFVSQHPLARDGGVVLNVEARGSSGPVIMFETTRGNAGVVEVYAQHAEHPVASSFAVEVYRILPNDTDLRLFRDAGRFTGLNAAYIDGWAAYHSPQDTPAAMDQGSLQAHGDNALALARAFGAADLGALAQPSSGDLTYFPVFGWLARYPEVLVWPLAGLALIAVLGLAFLARRQRRLGWPRYLGGVGLGLVPLLVAPVAAQALWALLVAIRPGYASMGDPWRPGLFRAGVVALTFAVLLLWYGLFRRRLGAWPLLLGGLTWLAILGLALAALAPGGSYFAALPALFVAGALIGSLLFRRTGMALSVVTLGAGVAVVVLAPLIVLFFPALGLATGGAGALLNVLLGFAVLPVLAQVYPPLPLPDAVVDSPLWTVSPVRRRGLSSLPAVVAGLVAVAFVGAGLATDHFDAAHPVPTRLLYALDADTGQARWVSGETSPGEWTRQYVTGEEDLSATFPFLDDGYPARLATGPAEAADLPAPAVAVVSDSSSSSGGPRSVELLITPQRAVRLVYLRLTGASVTSAIVEGRAVPAAQLGGEAFSLLFHAPRPEGVTVRLSLSGSGPLTLRVLDGSDGLTGLPGFLPRPAGVGIKGSHDAELVLVAKTYHV